MNNVDKSIKHSKESKHTKESNDFSDSKESKESKTIVEDARQPAEKPISLRPLEFEEAVKGLLQVKPSATKLELTRKRESGNG